MASYSIGTGTQCGQYLNLATWEKLLFLISDHDKASPKVSTGIRGKGESCQKLKWVRAQGEQLFMDVIFLT